MGKIPFVFVLILVVVLVSGCASTSDQGVTSDQGTASDQESKPNFVFILTDDMRKDDLDYMPKTKSLIFDEGITYDDAFVTTSHCCPSRVSILRGQYVHNHKVYDNSPKGAPGGYSTFESNGLEASNVATWLDDAGYETMLAGKFVNGYGVDMGYEHVPAGWDEWYAHTKQEVNDYDYALSENGSLVSYGNSPSDYFTDVISGKTTDFISRVPADRPLFAYVAPTAPHYPATPAPRHEGAFADEEAPRPPSFDEEDVSDKPPMVQQRPRLDATTREGLDEIHRDMLRSLQAVDEMVEAIIEELSAAGRLENTYLVFTSDNGLMLGLHRVSDKVFAYEESIRVPLGLRGPGVLAGRHTNQQALNTDIAPTLADLAGVSAPSFVDGRSLAPTFAEDASPWRTGFLEEAWAQGEAPTHKGVRTDDGKKYVVFGTGFEEYYDLNDDPYELDNAAPDADLADLRARFAALYGCSGQSCRDAEDGTSTASAITAQAAAEAVVADDPGWSFNEKKRRKREDAGDTEKGP